MSDNTSPHDRFRHVALSTGGTNATDKVGAIFSDALTRLETVIPPCREHSIVVTKLEEACFFAKRAIARFHEERTAPEIAPSLPVPSP